MRLNRSSCWNFTLQLFRFGITGAFATLTHFTVVIILVEIKKLHPLTANLFGFMCGFLVSFSGHRFWTFSKTVQSIQISLLRFFLVAVISFIGNQSFYYLLLIQLHVPYIIALIVVLSSMAFVTFLFSKGWAFQ